MNSKKTSLTIKAVLTFLSSLLRQAIKLLTSFIVTPIIVHGLGQELYGAWTMIQQVTSYFNLSDLRPTATLRYLIALKQHDSDVNEKQRFIGASILVWAVSVPMMIAGGAILIYYIPNIIHIPDNYLLALRITVAIVLIETVFDRMLGLPSDVLRGQNLDYKGAWSNAITLLLGGTLSALAILAGWGLPGLAFALLAGTLLTSGVRYWVARRTLPWFRIAYPTKDEFWSFLKISMLLTATGFSSLLLYSSEIILVGYILGPVVSSVYSMTGTVLRMGADTLSQLISSGNSGLTGLIAQDERERVAQIRKEMRIFTIILCSITGASVLAMNKAFLNLWVGSEYYGGTALTFLLALNILISQIGRIEAMIVSSLKLLKEQNRAILVGGVLTISAGWFLLQRIGLAGMAIGALTGQLVVAATLSIPISRWLNLSWKQQINDVGRALGASTLMWATMLVVTPYLHFDGWFGFTIGMIIVGLINGSIGYFIGLDAKMRMKFLERLMFRQYLDKIMGFRK